MNWILHNPFVLSMNLHDGATVASYPFDDFYSKNDKDGARITSGKISKSPDHEVMIHLAKSYANLNPVMKHGNNCPDESFPNGIVNGAEW